MPLKPFHNDGLEGQADFHSPGFERLEKMKFGWVVGACINSVKSLLRNQGRCLLLTALLNEDSQLLSWKNHMIYYVQLMLQVCRHRCLLSDF